MGRLPRAVAVTAVGAGLAGAALALWSPDTLAAAAGLAAPDGQAAPITVIPEDGPAELYPGLTAGDVHVRLQNRNPFPVRVEAVVPEAVTSSDPAACPSSTVTVRPADGLGFVAPPEATTPPLTIPDVVSMAGDAPDGCQGVRFTIALKVGDPG